MADALIAALAKRNGAILVHKDPEYEVLRLSEVEKLKQEEIAKRMKTSRGTVWRLLENAREKVARALSESRPLLISPKGEIEKV